MKFRFFLVKTSLRRCFSTESCCFGSTGCDIVAAGNLKSELQYTEKTPESQIMVLIPIPLLGLASEHPQPKHWKHSTIWSEKQHKKKLFWIFTKDVFVLANEAFIFVMFLWYICQVGLIMLCCFFGLLLSIKYNYCVPSASVYRASWCYLCLFFIT